MGMVPSPPIVNNLEPLFFKKTDGSACPKPGEPGAFGYEFFLLQNAILSLAEN